MNGLHCAFQGRVGTDPELKLTGTGKALLSFSVAVDENRAGGDGAETTWVRVTAWEELAEQLAEALHKGDEAYCEGKLKLNTWQGQDGQQRAGLNLSAWTVQPIAVFKAPKRSASDRMPERNAIGARR